MPLLIVGFATEMIPLELQSQLQYQRLLKHSQHCHGIALPKWWMDGRRQVCVKRGYAYYCEKSQQHLENKQHFNDQFFDHETELLCTSQATTFLPAP